MNKKINISIVGTGLMGLQHIKAISKSKKANLHSIVDINKRTSMFMFSCQLCSALYLSLFPGFMLGNHWHYSGAHVG